ncbi:MAG: aspartate kinase [Bacteroidales bacterium]|nr:aspartate kinase [Bacteroidales bacterium]MCF8338090.1 aspartate kinase [Bacteroidales bacterium]
MKVYKFGGASLQTAASIRNLVSILQKYPADVVVVSAMNKMTNAFEELVDSYFHHRPDMQEKFNIIKDYHRTIARELFTDHSQATGDLEKLFSTIEERMQKVPFVNYDKTYDQLVPYGEKLSSTILYHHLKQEGFNCRWLDATELIHTDANFREARLEDKKTRESLDKTLQQDGLKLTQGFIGGCKEGYMTTLGREGSDYTAALIAAFTGAEDVTIWKDVPGLLNADPRYFEQTEILSHISYHEAVELAFYGAKVIHPKTIKPLQNYHIPMYVRSFLEPEKPGSLIDSSTEWDDNITSYIVKRNQVLLTLQTMDFSFMAEDHLHHLYGIFNKLGIKLNLMQNSAITLSVCFDKEDEKLESLLRAVEKTHHFKYNEGLDLITLRHYSTEAIQRVTRNRKVLLDQRSRRTAQLVVY